MLTELSLFLGVIDQEAFDARMAYLAELLSGPGGTSNAGSAGGGGEIGPSYPEGPDAARGAHPELLDPVGSAGAPPDWIHFIPGGAIGHLRQWEFIKGDPDPHPSVPHGHDHGRTFPKLDPYLGWMHASTTKTSGRLSQDDARALWNDARFRDFASAALVHFAQENPNYIWRVPYPLRIPRRR